MSVDDILGPMDSPVDRLASRLVESSESLLDNLIRKRESLGLSQQEVAERLGVTQSAVAKFESGERDPRLSTLRRYALAVMCNISFEVTEYQETSREYNNRNMAYSQVRAVFMGTETTPPPSPLGDDWTSVHTRKQFSV